MAVELGHKALAEAAHLGVAAAAGIKVAAALAAAHGQGGQGVFQSLLKAEELHDGGVDAGVQTQTALVGADGAVELDTEATVHVDVALVIGPGNLEGDHALRLHKTLKNAVGLILRVLFHDALKALQNLVNRLMELRLVGVALDKLVVNSLNVCVGHVNASLK